jgi:branched-chain amino acid transport system substrate-binding protein
MPYSGPANAYGTIGKITNAYLHRINEAGGVNGRKILLISFDDGFSPAKSVERTRKLIEEEGVAFMFSSVGGATNKAVQSYLNQRGIPQLFVANGKDSWADPAHYPWTIGWQPSYRIEARVYAKYLLAHKPDAKICVLFQNDSFGEDYLDGLKDGLGAHHAKMVTKTASYELTDPTIESQIAALWNSGCDTLLAAATYKFAVQTIRRVFDLGWKPVFFLPNVSASIPVVLQVAGIDKAVGLITSVYLKDPQDPANQRDPGIAEWRKLMDEYVPDGDRSDSNYLYGYAVTETLIQVLKQCGNDLSRRNVMKQAARLRHFKPSVLIDGIEIDTDATDYRPITRLQLARFNGKTFERFGNVIAGE